MEDVKERMLMSKETGMLVLTRQVNETTMIGDNISITVLSVRGDKVRLGFTAPKDVEIHRKEVYEEIKRDQSGM